MAVNIRLQLFRLVKGRTQNEWATVEHNNSGVNGLAMALITFSNSFCARRVSATLLLINTTGSPAVSFSD